MTTDLKCNNPPSLNCTWDPARCVTHRAPDYPADLPDGHSSTGHLTILIDGKNRCPACAAEEPFVPVWLRRRNLEGQAKDLTGGIR